MSNELARAKKKYLAIRRAERRLQNRIADIDWEFDVLIPEVEKLGLEIAKTGELPIFTVEADEDYS